MESALTISACSDLASSVSEFTSVSDDKILILGGNTQRATKTLVFNHIMLNGQFVDPETELPEVGFRSVALPTDPSPAPPPQPGPSRERAEQAKTNGEYLRSHALQALALETAEAAAEWLHRRIRDAWGIADDPDLSTKDLFKARYRGNRYSPGYPACPDLDDQQAIFDLLQPTDIGVHLTEGMMMDPEASVSAIVFHHPDCTYFSATGVTR